MTRRFESVARAIITIGGQVLCCRGRGESFWHLPGGHIEAGEEPADALMRELREELGRDLSELRPVGQLENTFTARGDTIIETNYLFAVKLLPAATEVPPVAQEAHLELRWVPIHELSRVRLMPPAVYPFVAQVGGA